jgi:hypothetical protein
MAFLTTTGTTTTPKEGFREQSDPENRGDCPAKGELWLKARFWILASSGQKGWAMPEEREDRRLEGEFEPRFFDAFAKTRRMARQKCRPTRLGGKAYIRYVEVLKKRRNAVGRIFCDANG